MNVYEFLEKLNKFFPSSDNKDIFQERVTEYSKEILNIANGKNVEYDYDKIFSYFLKNYRYKTFPALADIVAALDNGIIHNDTGCPDEGKVIIATLPSGYKYLFEISGIGKPIEQIKASLFKRFGQCTVKMYPAGTYLIGNSIYVPDEETQEQSIKQGSLLWKT